MLPQSSLLPHTDLVLAFLDTNWAATLAHFSASLTAITSCCISSESGNLFSSASVMYSFRSGNSVTRPVKKNP